MEDDSSVRYCETCRWSKDGHNAGTEECHLCMWENQYEPRVMAEKENKDRIGKVNFTNGDTAMLASVLVDISKSLAVIADCCLDTWQRDQVDRFMSMTQEDRKIFSDYMKQDEASIINQLLTSMPGSKIDQFNDKIREETDGQN